MDVNKALRELYKEKKRLDRAIARIESRLVSASQTPKPSTRGRKSMGPEERLQVSERMSAYWAARRAPAQAEPATDPPAGEDPESGGEGFNA